MHPLIIELFLNEKLIEYIQSKCAIFTLGAHCTYILYNLCNAIWLQNIARCVHSEQYFQSAEAVNDTLALHPCHKYVFFFKSCLVW